MDKNKIFNMGIASIVCAIFCFIAAYIMSGTSAWLAAIIGIGLTAFGGWLTWEAHKIQPEDDMVSKDNKEVQMQTTVTDYVFVANHGEKYHKDPCCGGNMDMQRISKSIAIEKGYVQCKRCQYYPFGN